MELLIRFYFVCWVQAVNGLGLSSEKINVTDNELPLIKPKNDRNSILNHLITLEPYNSDAYRFVIPSLIETKEDCLDTRRPTWLHLALGVGNQRFETVIISPDQILNWDLELNWFHRYARPKAFDSLLNIIIEFPDSGELGCAYNRTNFNSAIENGRLFNAENQRESIYVKALVFPIENTIHAEFARRISSNITVGCTIWLQENMTNVTEIVNACKNFNGSLYILKTQLDIFPSQYSKSEIRNDIHWHLEAIRTFRDELLDDQTAVYFFVELRAPHDFFTEGYNYQCSESAISAGFITDVIVNWAKFQNFPVVLRPLFDLQKSPRVDFLRRWNMFLRQLSYPPEVQLDSKKIFLGESKSSVSRKIFSDGNVSSEACINPSVLIAEALKGSSFDLFHNENIGAIFYSEEGALSNVTTVEEYATMLQFIFYKFHMVEIIIGENFKLLLNAMDLILKLQPDIKTVIYLQYTPLVNNVSELNLLLDAVEKSQIFQETKLIKGIHIDVSAIHHKPAFNSEAAYGLPLAKSIFKTLESAQHSKIPIGIFFNSMVNCRNVIDSWILGAVREDIGWSIFNKASYVVCAEILGQEVNDGNRIDTHLYIRRVLGKFLPNLHVKFRLHSMPFLTAADRPEHDKRSTMQLYLYLLSIFKAFGFSNNISYFIVNAFGVSGDLKGWWEIKNHSDLANPNAYHEREAEYLERSMWYPTPISKLLLNKTHLSLDNNSSTVYIVSSVGSVLLLLFAAFGIVFFVRYRKLRQFLSDSEIKEFLNGRTRSANDDTLGMDMEATGNAEYKGFNPEHNLSLSDITIDLQKVLGSGAFGTVFGGIVKGNPAAIKQPNRDCSKATFKSVLIEVKVLSYIGEHVNVVMFLGAYVKEIHQGLIYVATELCSNGSLESLLRKKVNVISEDGRNMSTDNCLFYHDLHMFATQISNGMDYIASRQVVHGDLATRNILLDENLTCKIGDFGLSRKLYEYQKYVKTSQEPLPWKWLAYESLVKMEFTSQSDVWSFGVTLWEIYSLGKIPFSGLNWTPGFADELKNGLQLTAPEFASQEIFYKMQECWKLDADHRPKFENLSSFFRELCDSQYITL